jgi:hypothetical protein
MSAKLFHSSLLLIRSKKINVNHLTGLQSQRFYSKSRLFFNNKLLAPFCSNCHQIRYGSNIGTNLPKTEYINQMPETVDKVANIFSDMPWTHLAENILINFHDLTSFEWSSAIFFSALFLRIAVCFPMRIYQERLQAKGLNLQPLVKEAVEKSLKNTESNQLTKNDFQIRFTQEMQKKIAKENEIKVNIFLILFAVICVI